MPARYGMPGRLAEMRPTARPADEVHPHGFGRAEILARRSSPHAPRRRAAVAARPGPPSIVVLAVVPEAEGDDAPRRLAGEDVAGAHEDAAVRHGRAAVGLPDDDG